MQILDNYGCNKIKVVIIPKQISPGITGVIAPILIISDTTFTNTELCCIIKHELKHFQNFDLWLKFLVEIMLCIYWWNPIIYSLRSSLLLAMEISNDMTTIKDMADYEKTVYASCIINISRKLIDKNINNTVIPFLFKPSEVKIRINEINNSINNKKNISTHSIKLNCAIVTMVIILSFVFVPEGYKVPSNIDNTSFSITNDNSYMIKTKHGFELYIDGKYQTTLPKVDNSMKNIKIYSEY